MVVRTSRSQTARALGLWALGLVLAALVIVNARFIADMSAFLPRAPDRQQQLLVDQITTGAISRMLLLGLEGGRAEDRVEGSKLLAQRLRQAGPFTLVANGELAAFERDQAFLFGNRYLLSPRIDPARFSVAGLHDAIGQSIAALATTAGPLLKKVFAQDPTGELLALLDGLAPGDMPNHDGVWLSRDEQRAILMAQTRAAGADTDAMEAAINAVRQSWQALQAEQKSLQSVKLLVSGAPVFAVGARETIRAEAMRMSIVGTFCVLLLLIWVYRSALTVVMSLMPVASAVVAGIAMVALCFGPVHGITVGFGTTLVGEAVDYSIYYFVQSGATRPGVAPSDRAHWVRHFWPTIRLGVLTSVFGFSALVLSDFPGLAQLGVYSLTGLCVAALVTRYVLPHLPQPPVDLGRLRRLGQRLARTVEQLRALRSLVWALGVAAVACVAWLATHGGLWNQTLSALSPVPKEAQDLDESLRRDLGQPDLRYLVAVTGANQAQARERAEAVGHAFDTLVQQGVLAGYQSPARYLPSPSLQQRRRDALPDTATLEARLDEALHTLPVDRAKLQPFVEAVERARHAPLLTPESLQGTALALTVEAMLVEGKSGWTALLPLRPAVGADGKLLEIDSAAVTRALAGFDSDQVIFFDISTQMRRIYGTYFNDALLHALGGLVAIVILLTVALRSLRRLLNVIVPLLLAVAVVIAGLVLSGERLTLLHLIGLLLIFAVGSNYTLFFDGQSKGTETGAGTATPGQSTSGDGDYAVTLASLAVANMTTILGFGVLGLSRVPVLHAIGVTVAPGAALALLFAAILVRRRPAA